MQVIKGAAAVSGRTNAPAADPRLFTDKTPSGKIDRAVFQYGDNQLSFVIPEGFVGALDPARSSARLSAKLQATIILTVLPASQKSDAGPSDSSLRARALSDFPHAQVVDQFEVSVENWRGPAIELEQPAGSMKKSALRLARIPLPSGVLVFSSQAPAEQMRACDHPFNQLLLSIRYGPNGHAAAFQQFLPEL